MVGGEIKIEIVFENEKAMEALGEAIEIIQDTIEDSPWMTDLQEAFEKLQYAVEHIDIVGTPPDGCDYDCEHCDNCDCDVIVCDDNEEEAIDEIEFIDMRYEDAMFLDDDDDDGQLQPGII